MKTSRQRLLDYIATQKAVTAIDLSRGLKMTPANARHHLGILEAEGLVEVAGTRPADGRGRPALLYCISSRALGLSLEPLASALLDELLAGLAEKERAQMLRRLAARVAAPSSHISKSPTSPEEKRGRSLTQRLFFTVRRLNEQSYQARWEARPDAPRLILGRCPYAKLLPDHPEMCQLDAAILENMLGVPVQQTARLEKDFSGLPFCAFRVGRVDKQESTTNIP